MRLAPNVLLLLSCAAVARAETKIAVVPVSTSEADTQMGVLITDIITTEAGKRTDLKVIGSNELKNIVTFEQQKSLVGCTADSCLAEVGAALGVDAILSGSLGKLGDTYVLNLQLMDTHKAAPLSRATEKAVKADAFLDVIPNMVGTVLQVFPGGPPPPPRPAAAATTKEATTSSAGASSAQGGDGKKEEGGGSSLGRRLAGVGLAGAGVLLMVLAAAVGAGSLGFMVLTRVGGMPLSGLNASPARYGNYGIGAVADVVGVVALLLLVGGVVVAAIP